MKLHWILLVSTSVGCLLSCQSNIDDKTERVHRKAVGTYEINPFSAHTYKLTEIVDSISYIILETNEKSLIGNITEVLFHQDKIIIFDRFITKAIFIFSIEGKFLSKIQRKGEAPGEYSYATDINIDSLNNLIELYDMGKQKIIVYDMEGNFKEEAQIGYQLEQYVDINNYKRVIYTGGGTTINEKLYSDNLIIIDRKSGDVVGHFLPIKPIRDNFIWVDALSKYGQHLYFNYGLNDTIYEIINDDISPKYFIDFGRRRVNDDILNLPDVDLISEKLIDGNFAYQIHRFKETDKHITFSYRFGKEFYSAIIFKEQNQLINIKSVEDDWGIGKYNPPISVFENKYISVLESQDLLALPPLDTVPESKSKKFSAIKKQFKEGDNPCLMLIHYKTKIAYE